MTSSNDSGLLRLLEQDCADRSEDLLNDLDNLVETGFRDPAPGEDLLRKIRRTAHNIKGLTASSQYKFLADLAHRLEDFIGILPTVEAHHLREIQTFVDAMREVLHSPGERGDQDRATIIAGLPEGRGTHVERAGSTTSDILLVVPEGTAARFISTELKDCGHGVVTECTALDALGRILAAPPDLVLVAAVLPDIAGIDLIRALGAMGLTRDIPVALITNQPPGQELMAQLPAATPVVRWGDDFSDDIANTLAGLGIT